MCVCVCVCVCVFEKDRKIETEEGLRERQENIGLLQNQQSITYMGP